MLNQNPEPEKWEGCDICGSEYQKSFLNAVENLNLPMGSRVCDECLVCSACLNYIPAEDLFIKNNTLYCDSCAAEQKNQKPNSKKICKE